jgi:hypothetical protein
MQYTKTKENEMEKIFFHLWEVTDEQVRSKILEELTKMDYYEKYPLNFVCSCGKQIWVYINKQTGFCTLICSSGHIINTVLPSIEISSVAFETLRKKIPDLDSCLLLQR